MLAARFVHAAGVPVAVHRHGLRAPMRPDAELGVAEPVEGKHKAIGGQIVRQVRGPPINTVGCIKLDRSHEVGWRSCHVAIHGIAAEFVYQFPADGPKRAIRRALVRRDRGEEWREERVIGAHQVLRVGERLRVSVIAAVNPKVGPGGGHRRVTSIQSQHLPVIVGVHGPAQNELPLVIDALNAKGLRLGFRERWQEQGGEDGDDRNHHQELDERKCRGRTKPRIASEAESFHNSATLAPGP
jgi:hypothetical protein